MKKVSETEGDHSECLVPSKFVESERGYHITDSEWETQNKQKLISFGSKIQKAQVLESETLQEISARLGQREHKWFAMFAKSQTAYRSRFMVLYAALGTLAIFMSYASTIRRKTHFNEMNNISLKYTDTIFQVIENKAQLVNKQRNLQPILNAQKDNGETITQDLESGQVDGHFFNGRRRMSRIEDMNLVVVPNFVTRERLSRNRTYNPPM